MISIFNGRSRGIGKHGQKEVYVQVSVKLRDYLHLFKGAKLAVFMAIALHTNEEGWSEPSINLLRAETGYNKETISTALTELCAIVLDGERVLLAAQRRGAGGSFTQNCYLVFPSPEECAKYEASGELRKPRATRQEPLAPASPRPEKPDTVEPSTGLPRPEKPCPVNPYGSITISKKTHDDGDDGRALEKNLLSRGMFPATVKQILAMDLDGATVITSVDTLIAAGWGIGSIADRLRATPPAKGHPYEQPPAGRPVQPDVQPNQPRRSRGSNPAIRNGVDLTVTPAWMAEEFRKLEERGL